MAEITDAITPEFREELVQFCEVRSSMYGLLSRLYEKEIDEELLDSLCAMKLPANTGNANIDKAYGMLAKYLSGRWERTVEDLSIDYVRVFFGNGMNAVNAAYPFESVHTSAERLMMQDARDEVLALYRAEGFTKAAAFKDNDDHIALELAFERVLCDKCADALRAGDVAAAGKSLATQYNFLNDHLLNWVFMLVASIDEFAQTDFYRALGSWTVGYLEEDQVFLEDVLGAFGYEVDHEY